MKHKLAASLKDLNLSEKEFKDLSEMFSGKKTPALNKALSNIIAILFIATGAIFIREFPDGTIKNLLLFVVWICMFSFASILVVQSRKCKMLMFKDKVSNFVLNQVMSDLSKLQKENQVEKDCISAEN